jgi:hypothetical protein
MDGWMDGWMEACMMDGWIDVRELEALDASKQQTFTHMALQLFA